MKIYRFIITILGILFSVFLLKSIIRLIIKKNSFKIFMGWKFFCPYFLKISAGHIMIYGKTGMGKSNTAKLLIKKISEKVPVLVLDWAGEYKLKNFIILEPGVTLFINPLKPYIKEEHIDFLVDLFGDSFNLTEPQRYMFRIALKNIFSKKSNPILTDVLEELTSIVSKSYYDHEIKMAIIRRLKPLTEGVIGQSLNSKKSSDIEELFTKNIIINLGKIRNIRIKKLFLLIVLKMLYDYSVMKRGIVDTIKHCTVIEEAWATIPYRRLDAFPSIGERLFAELRKYGECIIGISQSISDTAWSIVKNSEIVIIHRIFPKDIEILGIKDLLHDVNSLKRGQAYIVTNSGITKISVIRSRL